MFNKPDLQKNEFMLTGPLRRKGYDWWWHSFTGRHANTGEERAFFIEFFVCNPALGWDKPVLGQLPENRKRGKRPSYLMVKAGTWGEEVEWTKGEVNADAFIAALKEIGYDGCLAVDMRLAWLFGARGARALPFCVTFRGCCTIRGCARRYIAYKSARAVAYKPQKWYNSAVSKPRYSSKIVVCKPQYGR